MQELIRQGELTKIFDVEEGTSKAGKAWKKVNFVIDNGKQYNNEICFQIFGEEKVDKFIKFRSVGDFVEVKFNVSSREYNGKYYHNLDAWFVGNAGENPNAESTQEVSADVEEGDLPF